MPFTLSIVIPVYNESRTITQIIEKLFNCLSMIDFEIIIVDDCSIDNTVEILNRLTEQHENVTLVQHESNKGKTEALKTGFLYCSGNIVLVQDADLEYDPKDIPGLIQPILEDRADVVYGSRLSGRNNIFIFKSLLANKTLSFASNLFTKYKFSDVETCYKALRLDIIKNMIITSERFGFEIEVQKTGQDAHLNGPWRTVKRSMSHSNSE